VFVFCAFEEAIFGFWPKFGFGNAPKFKLSAETQIPVFVVY
jgi:hypothetical protein